MLYFIQEATKQLDNETTLDLNWSDILYNVDFEDCTNFDEMWDNVIEYAQDNDLLNVDFIYYHASVKYLLENDPSFSESLGLATDLGYEMSSLNSCTLASILATQENEQKFYDCSNIFETVIERTITSNGIFLGDLSAEDCNFLIQFDIDLDFLANAEGKYNFITHSVMAYEAEILLQNEDVFENSDLFNLLTSDIEGNEIENLLELYNRDQETAIALVLAPLV